MASPSLGDYVRLIASFVEGRISAAEFETAYLRKFKDDTTMWAPAEYAALNGLFGAVDEYCADPTLRSARSLDEEALLREASEALNAMKTLLAG